MLPGIFAQLQFETARRFLQAIGIFEITMYVMIVTMALHCVWCYFFLHVVGLGVVGVSIASLITDMSNLIVITIYMSYKKSSGIIPEETWHFFNKDSLKNWKSYIQYGFPAALMLSLEWWCFEIIEIYSGLLSVDELAANVILLNLVLLLFCIPYGISFVVCNLVGNSLGEMKPNKAKTYFQTSMVLIGCVIVALGALTLSTKDYIPLIYTNQESVSSLVTDCLPLFCVSMVFDFIQGTESGSIKAIGLQSYASIICLVSYWCFSTPISYLLSIPFSLRLTGIWIGVAAGPFVASVWYTVILTKTDWQKVADESQERIMAEKDTLSEPLLDTDY